mmetsp:Transcript_60117/g.112312  ORF Transcript_60117/g.112312 Transcript_60117/m.112312 type:complete len:259 (-) Transcript_60117:65-841(-)
MLHFASLVIDHKAEFNSQGFEIISCGIIRLSILEKEVCSLKDALFQGTSKATCVSFPHHGICDPRKLCRCRAGGWHVHGLCVGHIAWCRTQPRGFAGLPAIPLSMSLMLPVFLATGGPVISCAMMISSHIARAMLGLVMSTTVIVLSESVGLAVWAKTLRGPVISFAVMISSHIARAVLNLVMPIVLLVSVGLAVSTKALGGRAACCEKEATHVEGLLSLLHLLGRKLTTSDCRRTGLCILWLCPILSGLEEKKFCQT